MKKLFIIPLLGVLVALINLAGCGSSCPAGTIQSAGQCVALNGATLGTNGTNQCYDSQTGSYYYSPTGVCNSTTGIGGQCLNPSTGTYYTPAPGQVCTNAGTTSGQCYNPSTGTYYTPVIGQVCPTTGTSTGQCYNAQTGTYYTVTPGTICPTTSGYTTGYPGSYGYPGTYGGSPTGSYLNQGTDLCTNPTTGATYPPQGGGNPCPY